MNTGSLEGPRKTGLVGVFLLWAVCLGVFLLAGCRRAVIVERHAPKEDTGSSSAAQDQESEQIQADIPQKNSFARADERDTAFEENVGGFSAAGSGQFKPEGSPSGEESTERVSEGMEDVRSAQRDGSTPDEDVTIGEGQICVHVSGAVREPGVYILPVGARVFQAVEAAGGFAVDADRDWCNQAMALMDADKLVIHTWEETAQMREEQLTPAGDQFGIIHAGDASSGGAAGGSGSLTGGIGSGPVNLNTAGVDQLTTLPGIGQKRAEDIIAYREMHGGFSSVEELANISGIGSKMLEKLRASVTV